ncbi:MAG: transporter substrate-binding domain-containing protein [Ruminococcus sp.]|nr:transporter substrate-binding domain-containing protein [Ruminococcus sp.]
MHKIKSAFLILSVMLGIFTACAEKPEQVTLDDIKARGEIIVGVKNDVPYFSYYDSISGGYSGYEIELAQMIAEDLFGSRDSISFVPVTTKTRPVKLSNGEIDMAIATFTITEERIDNFNFSPSYYADFTGLLVMADSGIRDISDLNGKSVGVMQNSSAGKSINEAAANLGISVRIVTYATYDDIQQAVLARRCDAFCTDRAILKGYMTEDTLITPDRFSPQNYAVATKKENIELAAYIDGLISKWDGDGTLDALKTKYGI